MTVTDIYANHPYNPFDNPVKKDSETDALAAAQQTVATKDMFLKLLVAQLSHQNPLEPSDGTQFVTQLAQFTSLEQSTQMAQDLQAIRAALSQPAPTDSSTDDKDGTSNAGAA